MVADNLLQRLKDLWVFLAEPVDGQRHLVLVVVEFTGRITGELEDGRTAHAPMGDEQRPRRAEVGARDKDRGTLDHRAHQGAQGFVGDGEGKEGGDW